MKKLLLLLLFIAAFCVTAGALDFGIDIDNTTGYRQDGLPGTNDLSDIFKQENNVEPWFKMWFGDSSRINIRGVYTFTLDRLYLLDLKEFFFTSRLLFEDNDPSSFLFTIGRHRFTDPSGYVLSQTADGFTMDFQYPFVSVGVSAGYTGLVIQPNSVNVVSLSDIVDYNDSSSIFGPPRLFGSFDFSFPGLVPQADIFFSVLFQQDMRDPETLVEEGAEDTSITAGGAFNTQYVGAGIAGSMTPYLYYKAFGYFSTGSMLTYMQDANSLTGFSYQYVSIISGFGGAGLTYFNKELLFTRAGIEVLYSTGDEDALSYYEGNVSGSFNQFTPISLNPLSKIFTPTIGNIIKPELHYSLKPLSFLEGSIAENMQVVAAVTPWLRAVTGPVSSPGVNPLDGDLYLGTEIEFNVLFVPFSDAAAAIKTGVFLPAEGNVYLADRDASLLFELFVSLKI